MIRENIVNKPVAAHITSLPVNQTTIAIINLISKWLPAFREKFISEPFSTGEDAISRELGIFLNHNIESFVFRFHERQGVDFQILIKSYQLWAEPIFMIEAKRLPSSNNSKEYVIGHTGGIERFKREHRDFSFGINNCAMVAYVQKYTFDYWFNRINGWLTQLIVDSDNYDGFDWEDSDKLVAVSSNPIEVARYTSNHSRKTLPRLTIDHFWLDMRVNEPIRKEF